jgi:ligand-binding sensor domain-containing protein/anti-sigma regulatory factor (Ser/Thr protein kinase)
MKMLLKRILILCLCLFLYAHLCRAASPDNLYFDRITTMHGLSHNRVNCILQDKRGFIWIGTDDGLNRYDGHNFLVFQNKPGQAGGISGNVITDLHEDSEGILWIATADGGLTRYDYRLAPQLQFRQYKHSAADSTSIPDNIVNDMLEDHDGNLWLATGRFSVIRFNKKTEKFKLIPVMRGTRNALDMAIDKNGVIWVGRQGGGILKVNPRTMVAEMDNRYLDIYARNLPHVTVSALYTDRNRNMWYGSWDHFLYTYDMSENAEFRISQSNQPYSYIGDELLTFAEDASGNLWMGGRFMGLQVYEKKTGKFFNYRYDPSKEGSIADNRVNCIFIDKSGTAWIGTNKGVSISSPSLQQFTQVFLPRSPLTGNRQITIYDFYTGKTNDLWIGTSEGLFIQKNGSGALTHKPLKYKGNALSVTKFFSDESGNMFLGTNYSLFAYDPEKNTLSLLPNTEKDRVMNGIIDSRVVSVVKDTINGHPVLLVSPYGHFIAYYDLVDKKWVSREDTAMKIIDRFNLRDNLVRKFYKTSKGQIWLATAKLGLGKWVTNSLPNVSYLVNDPGKPDGISNNDVFDMTEDSRGNLWVNTYGGGLHHFSTATQKFSHISASSNLQEGLQVDENDIVWMVSNGNLHRYNPADSSYTVFDLPDLEKSGGVRGYIFKDNNGKMYVAGTNFFISFHPDSVKLHRAEPRIFLTDFKIFNNSYSDLLFTKGAELKYNQNYFTIQFSAPDYSPASPMQYAYMLQGVDPDWIEVGQRDFAFYSNLPGGHYVFKVKATNDPGRWGKEIASFPITITPPFWKTWWFYLTCALALAVMVYAIYRYRINEILKMQAIRNKIAQDLHDHVGSTLSSVSVYSQVAQIQGELGNKELMKDVLQKISVTATDMISEMSDIVWAINPRNDSLEKILQRMDSFAKPLLKARDIRCDFQYPNSLLNLNLGMEKRKNFYLIFKEAVNNALKYSSCKQLTVKVKSSHHHLELEVSDDGIGFDKEQVKANLSQSLSGNGFQNMQRRAKEMKGECQVTSSKGNGTTIYLRFPIT